MRDRTALAAVSSTGPLRPERPPTEDGLIRPRAALAATTACTPSPGHRRAVIALQLHMPPSAPAAGLHTKQLRRLDALNSQHWKAYLRVKHGAISTITRMSLHRRCGNTDNSFTFSHPAARHSPGTPAFSVCRVAPRLAADSLCIPAVQQSLSIKAASVPAWCYRAPSMSTTASIGLRMPSFACRLCASVRRCGTGLGVIAQDRAVGFAAFVRCGWPCS